MTPGQPLRIGYSTLRDDPTGPGDRRRFCRYAAQRALSWEIARPDRSYDVVVSSVGGDLSSWRGLPRQTRFVFDVVDSYLAPPGADPRAWLRGLFKFLSGHTRHLHLDFRQLIIDCLRRADAVICCTQEQRESLRAYCANVHEILDIQSEAVRHVKQDYARGERFQLVWEGLALNLHTFRAIAGALRTLAARHPIELHLVTDLECPRGSTYLWKRPTRDVVREVLGMDNVHVHAWNADRLSEVATGCDLAVIPIPLDVPFLRGKPENKLVLFWRMGMPVVTSATPAYERAMRAAGLSLTCRTEAEWLEMLERLMLDEGLRREAGRLGAAHAEAAYGEAGLLARWDDVFRSVLGERGAG
jgi:glycosyltransferase involved in cell wall biosynthesis